MRNYKPNEMKEDIVYQNLEGFWRYDGEVKTNTETLHKFTKIIFDDNDNEVVTNTVVYKNRIDLRFE